MSMLLDIYIVSMEEYNDFTAAVALSVFVQNVYFVVLLTARKVIMQLAKISTLQYFDCGRIKMPA